MGPKQQKKITKRTGIEVDNWANEFSDGVESQDENDNNQEKDKELSNKPEITMSDKVTKYKDKETAQGVPKEKPEKGSITGTTGDVNKTAETDSKKSKEVATSSLKDEIFTTAFLYQLLIQVGVLVVLLVVLLGVFWLAFTNHMKQEQVSFLKESLNITEKGQRYIDTSINDAMSVRIPVIMSNSTPTVMEDKITEGIDDYIKTHLSDLVQSHIEKNHKSNVENMITEKLNKLINDTIDNPQTDETINQRVVDKLQTKISKSIADHFPSMIEEKLVNENENIKGKIKDHVSEQVTNEVPKQVQTEVETEGAKAKLHETLSNHISERVTQMSPQLIQKFSSDKNVIEKIDSALNGLLNAQLNLLDMTSKVDEAFVQQRLSTKINEVAVQILENETEIQADSKIKKKFDIIIETYTSKRDNFQKELESNIERLKTVVEETETCIARIKEDFQLQNLGTLQARQDGHKNLLVLLGGIIIVLLLCVFYLFQRQNNNPLTNVQTRRGDLQPGHRRGQYIHNVCIILFNDKLCDEISNMAQQVGITDYQYYVINKHDQISQLPNCKVSIMCCEFTERHVIIEQEGLGLGDLHRRTYEQALKISDQQIILYIHDPGSRQLVGKLYNEDISCVKTQVELTQLSNIGCFFSCYRNLSDYQIRKLKEKLKV